MPLSGKTPRALAAAFALASACRPPAPPPEPPPAPVIPAIAPEAPEIVDIPQAVVEPLVRWGPSFTGRAPSSARRTERDESWVATCDDLFVLDAPEWIRARLSPPRRAVWSTYCEPPVPLGRIRLPLPPPDLDTHSLEHFRREERAAARRLARRAAAIRALDRSVGVARAPAIDLLALGYLLAEKGYEDARGRAWSCSMCELGPPNVFSPEAFAKTASASPDLARALSLFERAAASADDAGWLAGFAAGRVRRDLGLAEDGAAPAALAARRPPEGTGDALAALAADALWRGDLALARSFLEALAAQKDPPRGATAWLHALSGRWSEALREAADAVFSWSTYAWPPRDLLTLGVIAAERAGMGSLPRGPGDGEALVALAAADDAIETGDPARARRWLAWIAERAPDATSAPAALEAAALLAEAEDDGARVRAARAALAAKLDPASTWTASLRKRAPAYEVDRLGSPLFLVPVRWAERAKTAVEIAADPARRAQGAARALGLRCFWDQVEPVRVGLTLAGASGPEITPETPLRAGARACMDQLAPIYFRGVVGHLRTGIQCTGAKR